MTAKFRCKELKKKMLLIQLKSRNFKITVIVYMKSNRMCLIISSWTRWFCQSLCRISWIYPAAVSAVNCVNVLTRQDFDMNGELKMGVIGLLEEVLRDPDLLPQERKATSNILRWTRRRRALRLFNNDDNNRNFRSFNIKTRLNVSVKFHVSLYL